MSYSHIVDWKTMTDYTVAEVDAALDAEDGYYGDTWTALIYEDYDFDSVELRGERVPFEVVEANDGGDREWEYEVFVVVKIGDQYFMRDGFYRSHEGITLDGGTREVVEGTKTVKVWNDK